MRNFLSRLKDGIIKFCKTAAHFLYAAIVNGNLAITLADGRISGQFKRGAFNLSGNIDLNKLVPVT